MNWIKRLFTKKETKQCDCDITFANNAYITNHIACIVCGKEKGSCY